LKICFKTIDHRLQAREPHQDRGSADHGGRRRREHQVRAPKPIRQIWSILGIWVRIQKPIVTVFAALPNIFYHQKFIFYHSMSDVSELAL
jgi:hypothetical protein